LELYEKIYVKTSFLETDHGQIACEDCHGGDPQDPDWQTAHKGIVKDPTFPNADQACGECHEEIVATAKKSLHYTLAPFDRTIEARANKKDPKVFEKVCQAKDTHCKACHASCGQCHVSRPDYVKGGFLNRHLFKKTPPMDTTCASCHGGRVHAEFTGTRKGFAADVHFDKEEMTCMDCHSAGEMHADAKGVANRFELPERPRCTQCHEEVVSAEPKTEAHKLHRDKVACQVCHAQANKNCFVCHVGTDKKGLKYFKNKATKILFKIGRNPDKTKDRPYDYVVLRHPPANPGLFDFYVEKGLPNFDLLPTWKLDTPHNIQRITAQNKQCNNCHGNASLFLSKGDMDAWEHKANAEVIVPEAKIPEARKEVGQ
jgi:thiosulfate/3-mercaptopyruvate sulfurtransferase